MTHLAMTLDTQRRRWLKTCGTAALLTTLPHSLTAALGRPPAMIDEELERIVNNPKLTLASLSVLAVRDGKVAYERQLGRRFIAPPDSKLADKPATSATLYRVASISKLITALGAMRLVEDNKLGLDADISDIIGTRIRNPNFPDAPITARQLLCHTSSLRDDAGYYWDAKQNINLWRDVLSPGGKQYGQGAMWARNAKPGRYFQYNNFAWGVLGSVMEKAAGERFDVLMQKLLFTPMGIVGSFHPYTMAAAERENVATLYRKRIETGGREVWNPKGLWVAQVDDYSVNPPEPRVLPDYELGSNGTLCGPQGNCRLSAQALGKIMLMLMNGGDTRVAGETRRILKPETIDLMLSQHWRYSAGADGKSPNGSNSFGSHRDLMNAWGLGNQHFLDVSGPGRGDRLVERGGYTAVGHLGDAWGLTSAFVFNPVQKSGMIYLIGGPSSDPEGNPGRYSGLYRHEEEILTALDRVVAD